MECVSLEDLGDPGRWRLEGSVNKTTLKLGRDGANSAARSQIRKEPRAKCPWFPGVFHKKC